MKKLLLLTLALVMVLSLAACGGETGTTAETTTEKTVSLVSVITQGITLSLPSDMTAQENGTYANLATADIASFGAFEIEAGEAPLSEWTQADVLAMYKESYADVVINSFETGLTLNGNDALQSTFTLTSSEGTSITGALIMVDSNGMSYTINLLYTSDNATGSLATNLQACMGSVTISA